MFTTLKSVLINLCSKMYMELHAIYRQDSLGEDKGYASTSDITGYVVVDELGNELAYGDSEQEAWQNAFEALWLI